MHKKTPVLRVIQYCDNFYPQIDGVVKVVNNCSKFLNISGDCEVVVPSYKKHPYDDSVFSYKVLRRHTYVFTFNKIEIPLPGKSKKIANRIYDFNADIYHAHSPFFLGHFALKLARKNNVPIVATFHSQFKEDLMSTTHSKFLTRLILRYIVSFFSKCDEVWAPSKMSADTLRSYGFKKEIYVMENGTDFTYPQDIITLKENAQKLYGIQSSNKNLLYVGQMRYIKNLKLVLQTVESLVKKDSSYHLYMVGDGSDEKSMKKFVKNHHLKNNVHFLGKIANTEILKGVYALCDLFFFPSTYDTFSIVVREASVMKVPSLLTRGSNTAEPFIDGKNGFLADEKDMEEKIIAIFNDETLRKQVGENAAKTIPISFETMAERTDERYRVIIERYKNEHTKR